MRKIVASIAAVLATVVLAATVQGQELIVPIFISPSTINLEAEGTWVTVHAEIDYGDVDKPNLTVTLNDIPVEFTFADNRGDLVAKFAVEDVRGIVQPGPAELTLAGTTLDGGTFSGTDMVRVISVQAKK